MFGRAANTLGIGPHSSCRFKVGLSMVEVGVRVSVSIRVGVRTPLYIGVANCQALGHVPHRLPII